MFKILIFVFVIFTFCLNASFTLELMNNNANAQVSLSPTGVDNTNKYKSKQARQYNYSEEYGTVLWKGKVNGNTIIITFDGFVENGNLRKTFRMRNTDLCIYGNSSFPESPKFNKYNIWNTWGSKWSQAMRNNVSFKKCLSIWKKFISSANISEAPSGDNVQKSGIKRKEDKKKKLALENIKDNEVCSKSLMGFIEFTFEARRRGIDCISMIDKKNEMKIPKTISLQSKSNSTICENATIVVRKDNSDEFYVSWGKTNIFEKYVIEAKQRGLTCNVKRTKEEKIRIAEEEAEQEKIRKKAEAEALKEKKAKEEKFRKENIARIKRDAKKREAADKLRKEIKAYKNEATFYYQDITEFVKSGAEIDLVKLTELFSKRPETNKKWNKRDIKNYKNLKSYLNNNQAFIDFEKSKKEARIAEANLDKSNTINSLNNNLKKLNSLLRENFGNDKVIKIIQSNIKKTKSILDGNFNQKKANKVLSDVNGYLSNYFDNKNKLKELNNYLNDKKLALTDILKNNFGTEKANTASKLISDIEKTKTVASKKQLKDKIDIFIKNPSKGIKKIKKINKEIALKQKFSDLLDNQICNRAVQDNEWITGNKDLIAEAKRRDLDCGIKTSSKSKIGNLKNKAVNYINKNLEICSNISGGWGKTKCIAMLKKLPMKFVCLGMQSGEIFDGKVEINIKNHKEILFNTSNVFFTGKSKIFYNNLLSNGTFSIGTEYRNVFLNKIVRKEIKFKISAFEIQYEQQYDGEYRHDGYCKKRL